MHLPDESSDNNGSPSVNSSFYGVERARALSLGDTVHCISFRAVRRVKRRLPCRENGGTCHESVSVCAYLREFMSDAAAASVSISDMAAH